MKKRIKIIKHHMKFLDEQPAFGRIDCHFERTFTVGKVL